MWKATAAHPLRSRSPHNFPLSLTLVHSIPVDLPPSCGRHARPSSLPLTGLGEALAEDMGRCIFWGSGLAKRVRGAGGSARHN